MKFLEQLLAKAKELPLAARPDGTLPSKLVEKIRSELPSVERSTGADADETDIWESLDYAPADAPAEADGASLDRALRDGLDLLDGRETVGSLCAAALPPEQVVVVNAAIKSNALIRRAQRLFERQGQSRLGASETAASPRRGQGTYVKAALLLVAVAFCVGPDPDSSQISSAPAHSAVLTQRVDGDHPPPVGRQDGEQTAPLVALVPPLPAVSVQEVPRVPQTPFHASPSGAVDTAARRTELQTAVAEATTGAISVAALVVDTAALVASMDAQTLGDSQGDLGSIRNPTVACRGAAIKIAAATELSSYGHVASFLYANDGRLIPTSHSYSPIVNIDAKRKWATRGDPTLWRSTQSSLAHCQGGRLRSITTYYTYDASGTLRSVHMGADLRVVATAETAGIGSLSIADARSRELEGAADLAWSLNSPWSDFAWEYPRLFRRDRFVELHDWDVRLRNSYAW